MASNQTNQVENLKQLIRDWFSEMLQILEAYRRSYDIDDFIRELLPMYEISDQVQEILEDIRTLGTEFSEVCIHFNSEAILKPLLHKYVQFNLY